ncbi:hypothetical protein [Mycolicibacterium sp.]|uniref:hypothetical protein n=1 Tax=Mycolicibacterium sp. TaxID=2320850 RepID=UPI00355DC4A8
MTPSIQIQAPTTGFILGHSRIGDPLSPADDAIEWLDFTPDATGFTITRGGRAGSGLSALDVGTVTATLKVPRTDNLTDDPALMPNRPIRVGVPDVEEQVAHHAASLTEMPTGRFRQTAVNHGGGIEWEPGPDGTLRLWSVDRVGDPGPADYWLTLTSRFYANEGDRFGYVWEFAPDQDLYFITREPGTGPEPTFYNHGQVIDYGDILEGGLVHRITAETVGSEPLIPPVTFWLAGLNVGDYFYIDVSEWSMSIYATREGAIFTGRIQDLNSVENKDADYAAVSLIGVDAVQSLANTTRYGRYNAANSATWDEAIAAYQQSSDVSFILPDHLARPISLLATDWTRYGTPPPNTDPAALWNDSGALVAWTPMTGPTVNLPARTWGIQTTLTDLDVGEQYDVEATLESRNNPTLRYALAVNDEWGVDQPIPYPGTRTLRTTFTATGPTASLKLAIARPVTDTSGPGVEFIVLRSVELTGGSDRYTLQNVALETSLDKHLSLACDSVGAYWFPNKAGAVEFVSSTARQFDLPVLADYPTEPGALSYTAIAMAYDSANIVNVLDVTNRGRINSGTQTGQVNDVTTGYTDPTSVASWGRRQSTVDLCLSPQYVDQRAHEILARRSQLQRIPTSVTFRALDDPELAVSLELTQTVKVTRLGTEYLCRIRGITHNVTPKRWTVTLDLDLL